MRTTAFCCVALVTAACGFEGSEGYQDGEPVSAGPPAEPLPTGTIEVTGQITSAPNDPNGEFYAVLFPQGTTLPATSPCPPMGSRSVWVDPRSDLSFRFKDVASGTYELAVMHYSPGRFHLERTFRTITVGTSTTAVGGVPLPAPLTATVREGGGFGPGGGDDKVLWSAPSGFNTSAFNVTNRAYVCYTGPVVAVRGNYEATANDVEIMKVVVESSDAKQMAVHVLDVD